MADASDADREATCFATQDGALEDDDVPPTQLPDADAAPTPPNIAAVLHRRRGGQQCQAMEIPLYFPAVIDPASGLPLDKFLTYGRSPGADITIPDDECRAPGGQLTSGFHFLAYSRASGIYIVDTSRTGTLVNGKPLHHRHCLRIDNNGELPRYDDIKNIGFGPLKHGWRVSLGRDNTSAGPLMPYEGMDFMVRALGGARFLGGTGTRTCRADVSPGAPTDKARATERLAAEARRREARCQRFGTSLKGAGGGTDRRKPRRPGAQPKASAEKRKEKRKAGEKNKKKHASKRRRGSVRASGRN